MIEPCRHPKSGPRECLGCFRKRDDAKPSADPLDRQSRVAQARDLSVPRSASGSSRNVPVAADSAAGTSRGAPVRSGLSAGGRSLERTCLHHGIFRVPAITPKAGGKKSKQPHASNLRKNRCAAGAPQPARLYAYPSQNEFFAGVADSGGFGVAPGVGGEGASKRASRDLKTASKSMINFGQNTKGSFF